MRSFWTGVLAGAALLIVLGAVALFTLPVGADAGFLPLERTVAQFSLKRAIRSGAPASPFPFAPTDADLSTGATLYVQNCAVCHGTPKRGENAIARGQYVRPPYFPKRDVADDPAGQTYWIIAHGARFTGMPAFGKLLSEKELWDLAFFLKRQNDLPPAAKALWEHPERVAAPTPGPEPADGPG